MPLGRNGVPTMTLKELTNTYNAIAEQLGRPLVKSFKDKPTAEARLAALQAELTPPPMPLAANAYARSMPTLELAPFLHLP